MIVLALTHLKRDLRHELVADMIVQEALVTDRPTGHIVQVIRRDRRMDTLVVERLQALHGRQRRAAVREAAILLHQEVAHRALLYREAVHLRAVAEAAAEHQDLDVGRK